MGLLPVVVQRGDTLLIALTATQQLVAAYWRHVAIQAWQAEGDGLEQGVEVGSRMHGD
jgi:predicted small integral membrane protein